jgi:hypothetical protein
MKYTAMIFLILCSCYSLTVYSKDYTSLDNTIGGFTCRASILLNSEQALQNLELADCIGVTFDYRSRYTLNGKEEDKEKVNDAFKAYVGELKQQVNFKKESLLIYSYYHSGSSGDRPVADLTMNNNMLRLKLTDKNTSMMRTSDFVRREHTVLIKVKKSVIERIDIDDQLRKNRHRSFFTSIEHSRMTEQQAQMIVQSFKRYQDKSLEDMKTLKSIAIGRHFLSNHDFMALGKLTQLESIELNNYKQYTERNIDQLTKLSHLKKLRLEGMYKDDDVLIPLKKLTLSHLDIEHVSSVGVQHLARISSLQYLNLRRQKLPLDVLNNLVTLTQLKGLTGIVVELASQAQKIGTLKKLETLNAVLIDDSAAMVKAWHELPKLKNLTLSRGSLNDEAMVYIGKMTQLRYLEIEGYNSITDKGLAHLKNLKKIEVLSLGRFTRFTDHSLSYITHLPLKKLDLRQSILSGEGVKLIVEAFPNLDELNLRHVPNEPWSEKLSKQSLLALKQLPKLQRLCVKSNISKEYFSGIEIHNQDISFKEATDHYMWRNYTY